MKKIFITSAIFLLFTFLTNQLLAQKKQSYVPEKGYWQLVSNLKDKRTVTVKFYTDQNEMIYEETLSNTRMNAERKKIRRKLYYALQEAYDQWAINQRINSTDLIAKRK